MYINDFIRLREKDWERLQKLLEKHRGRGRLRAVEARELGGLYRAVTSDLAQARRDYPNQRVTVYLNQLLTQAHSFIYRQEVSDFRVWLHYVRYGIPAVFRQAAPFILAAFLLFILPAVVGFRLASANPDVAEPLGLTNVRETLEDQMLWTDIPVDERPYTSAFIMGNNIRVALLAFGGGVAFGLFTVYILAMNGLIIGATFGLCTHYGLGGGLLDFVFAHGVIELSVIFIAGGAGLQIGWALLNPGLYSRRDALNLAARRVFVLAVCAVPLLIVAGAIEGFISPSDLSFIAKMGVGLGSGTLMYGYFLFSGRERKITERPTH
jgi:uncharacterized membrane protein SpoIIM required for sporulation